MASWRRAARRGAGAGALRVCEQRSADRSLHRQSYHMTPALSAQRSVLVWYPVLRLLHRYMRRHVLRAPVLPAPVRAPDSRCSLWCTVALLGATLVRSSIAHLSHRRCAAQRRALRGHKNPVARAARLARVGRELPVYINYRKCNTRQFCIS